MIVGTILLITMLFGGGAIDSFFVDKLDKGVKEYVLEKERQKDLSDDLKSTKKDIKKFNKGRKAQFKEFGELFDSRATTRDDFDRFYAELDKDREEFQDQLIDERLTLVQKIQEAEWASIVEFSEATIDKREDKQQKKLHKNNEKALKLAEKDPEKAQKKADKKQTFYKSRQAITEAVASPGERERILNSLDKMLEVSEELDLEIRSINVKENDVIGRRDATREDLKQIAQEMNELRRASFEQLVQMHMSVKENTDESQWGIILKALNKDLGLAVR